jgi:hypothetical protein
MNNKQFSVHKINVHRLICFETFLGMISYKEPTNLFFQTRFGIHTFGVKFPIDIIILDNNSIVRALKSNLSPNSIYLWNPKYQNVVELESGSIENNQIKLGDKVELTFL